MTVAKSQVGTVNKEVISDEYSKDGGWLQVKDTAVPYINRNGQPLMPVSVLKYAAQLITAVPSDTMLASKLERMQLNSLCEQAGLNFSFRDVTQLLGLDGLKLICPQEKCGIKHLPKDDPFQCSFDLDDETKLRGADTQNVKPSCNPKTTANEVPAHRSPPHNETTYEVSHNYYLNFYIDTFMVDTMT